jgi:hypothetical protein
MRERDFHDFLKSHSDLPFMKRPGTTALTRIFHDDMKQRDHRINFIGEFQSVLDRPMQFGAVVAHVKLQSLSPSGTAIRTTMSALSRQFPNPGKRMLAAVIPKDNLLSSAMHLGIGSTNILLGADLEFSSDDNTGWDAVISQDRVYLGKSDIYKVAHHGSATADQQRLWAKLLNPRPVCVICPANKGSYKLPKDSDLERIHTKTDQVYLTYDYRKVGRKRFDQVVEKTLRELGREIVPYVSGFGHVRLRGNVMPNGSVQNWSVLCNESEGE